MFVHPFRRGAARVDRFARPLLGYNWANGEEPNQLQRGRTCEFHWGTPCFIAVCRWLREGESRRRPDGNVAAPKRRRPWESTKPGGCARIENTAPAGG